MKKEVKSQAALEFLTTYAWAFMGIMVTIGALYYFGIFDFSKFLPQKCTFPSQFECLDFGFVGAEVRLKLVNNVGEPLQVSSITITNDAADPLTCNLASPASQFSWQPGDEMDVTFDTCTGGAFIEGQRSEAKITMIYCAPATTGCPPHTVNGKITAVVNPPVNPP